MGILYIVSTPIGNLKDITFRAIEILRKISLVACEDTRVTGKLLSHYDIKSPLMTLNDFNEEEKVPEIISRLKMNESVALVSDAGTPLISDPGFKLVRACLKYNIKIETIPGVSAVTTALTVSGLPTDKFLFVGFLSKKDGARIKVLNDLNAICNILGQTIIIFETPHRLVKTMHSIKEVFGDIEIAVARELTKLHEEVRREKISDSIDHFEKVKPKGEFVILLKS